MSNFNVSVVKNINTIDTYPSQLTAAGTNLFYTVADSTNSGQELVVTTAGGTPTELMDLADVGSLSQITAVGNSAYAIAGGQLWTSDGTVNGTQQITFSDPNDSYSTYVTDLASMGGKLYFVSDDDDAFTYGDDLWSVQPGSTTPTLIASDVESAGAPGEMANLTPVNGVLYFTVSASTGEPDEGELWQTSGTPGEAGPVTYVDPDTHQATDIPDVTQIVNFNGSLDYVTDDGYLNYYDLQTEPQQIADLEESYEVTNFTVAGSNLFFVAPNSAYANQVWVSNNTPGGTQAITDFTSSYGTPDYLSNVAGELYFDVPGPTGYYQLWKSSGTASGTSLVLDLTTQQPITGVHGGYSRYSDYDLGQLAAVGGTLFFANGDPTHGTELWDVSASRGPAMVDDIDAGPASSAPHDLVSFNGDVYFAAHNGSTPQDNQLWESNGTATNLVKSFPPAYTSGSFVSSLNTTLGPYVIFLAYDGVDGTAVWSSDGTAAGTELLAVGDPHRLVNFTNSPGNDEVYFITSSSPAGGPALWQTNGTVAGTSVVMQIPSSTYDQYNYSYFGDSDDYDLTVAGGNLFFITDDGVGGQDLWVSNGTNAGTTVLEDLKGSSGDSGSYYDLYVSDLTAAGGKLFFTADAPGGGGNLWVSNGTSAGTTVLKTFQPNSSYDYFSNLTAAGGELYFSGDDGTDGSQPWVSNGTTSGTVTLSDVNASNGGSSPSDFVTIGNEVYFFMNESASTVGLWKSGGTAASTSTVFDGFPSETYNSTTYTPLLNDLTVVGSRLFFSEYLDSYNTTAEELWTSSGTAGGTSQIIPASLPSGATLGEIDNLTALGSLLVFTADDGNGTQLWESNGTDSGTTVIDPNGPTVSSSSSYGDMVQNNGILYFEGTDTTDGSQVWQTNGTQAGTQMVSDINAGTGPYSDRYTDDGAYPKLLAYNDSQLFFFANNSIKGEQLWSASAGNGPTITPIQPQSVTVNQTLSFTVQATDGNDPLEYSLIDQPPSSTATIGSTSGRVLVDADCHRRLRVHHPGDRQQ